MPNHSTQGYFLTKTTLHSPILFKAQTKSISERTKGNYLECTIVINEGKQAISKEVKGQRCARAELFSSSKK